MSTGPMDSSPSLRPKSGGNFALIAICVCYLAVVMVTILNRKPMSDDGWFASPGYNLLHHGHFGTTTIDPRGYLLRAELTHIDRRTYWVMPLNLITQAGWYAIFGFGLVQMRLMTALFGVLAIIAVYRWMVRLTDDPMAASVAALLMAQDNILLWRSADGRMDVMCMSLGLLGQWAYLAWRERSLSKALLFSNALVCLSGLTHPNGIIMLLCLAASVLVLDGSRLRLSHVLPIAIPYVVGGAAYGAWILRDLDGFRGQMFGNLASNRVGLLSHPLDAIAEEIEMYKQVYIGSQYDTGRFAPIKIILLVTWLVGYLGQVAVRPLKGRASLVLALCGAIPVIVLTFFNARNAYYLIFIVPYFAANAGALFSWLWRKGVGQRRLATAVVALTVLVNVTVAGKRILKGRGDYQEYRRLSAEAANMLPPGGRLIAPAAYAFGIGFERVVDDDTLGMYSHWCPAVIIAGGLAPDEVENLKKGAPEVLDYRNKVLTEHYQAVEQSLYRRVSCPPGTRPN